MTKDGRGFAGMDEDEQRKIASLGGKAAHEKGVAHEFDHREAVEAGRKGGEAVSRDRAHMSEIGRLGGEHSHQGGEQGGDHGGSHGGGRSSEGASSGGKHASKSGYGEKAREFIHEEVKHHMDDKGMPQDQAVAVAMSEARRKGYQVPDEK